MRSRFDRFLGSLLGLSLGLGCESSSMPSGVDEPDPDVADAEVGDGDGDGDGDDDGDEDGGVTTSPKLGLSDLSILFPLPSDPASPSLLALDAAALDGPLLSQAHFNAIELFAQDSTGDMSYGKFRIVAMRVDPCFPDLTLLETDPASCRRQLRLVAQPLVSVDGAASALDSAIHLLYDLEPEAFRAVLERLVALCGERAVDPNEALRVSPTLVAEGESGATLRALRELILDHVGPHQLKRITFMQGNESFTWRFGGFDVGATELTPVVIHGIDVDAEDDGHSQTIGATGGLMSISPSTDNARALEPLMGDIDCGPNPAPGCASFALKHPECEITAALAAALTIENPLFETADSVDCASCHQAGPLRARAEALGRSTAGLPRFISTWNLALSNAPDLTGAPNRVRAFGYFHRDAVLAQRVVNETAAVADAINKMLEQEP